MSEKIIVTNMGRLEKKCGAGMKEVQKALETLIKKDKGRGINTKVIPLDDAKQMKKLNAPVVTSAKSPKQNKNAIDGIYKKLQPDYIMILGAIDVIPHQDLKNPKFSANDQDRCAYGDIPYSCDAPYSKEPANFRAPTRVVGRLPDLVLKRRPSAGVQSANADYLVKLLQAAANYKSRPAGDYQDYLSISAEVWKESTKMSLQNIFGSAGQLQLSPPKGPNWSSALFKRRSHFINCHGGEADPNYYGQKGYYNYPIAHSAEYATDSKISLGTVAAAECCYGAELYDPALTDGQAGICNTYLSSGAYAFFGSTTIAYGPADGNGAADLITQYFLKHILAGASVGRAALEARQDFVSAASSSSGGALNPVDLKTLVQFYVLGDPSVHPVERVETDSKALDTIMMKGVADSFVNFTAQRLVRRQRLVSTGLTLGETIAYPRLSKKLAAKGNVKKVLSKMAGNLKLRDADFISFDIRGGSHIKGGILPKAAFKKAIPKRVLHLVEGQTGPKKARIPSSVVIVAEEQNGKIVSVQQYYRR